ncbi:MAG: enoyl-CoA hydratase/isomerase family protein, partial [Chloroflexota bacterium]|nr:enoyl-CoA hydratase/isomerase family protein [Chloroflexota bacterium]
MSYQTIGLAKRDSVAYLSLQRPQQENRIDGQLLQELAAACEELNDDPQVRVAILSGGEAPVFSLGWDLSLLTEEGLALRLSKGLPRRSASGGLGHAFDCLGQLSRPVICAVNGDAISAGLELALACDVRLARPEARFALPETSWGLIPMGGGTQRLARVVGRGKALEMIMTAEAIDAGEAHRIGLVSQVVPRDGLMAEAVALALRNAARGPLAVRYAMEAVARGLDMTLE